MVARAVFKVIKFLHEMHMSGYVDDAEYFQLMRPLLGFVTMTSFGYPGTNTLENIKVFLEGCERDPELLPYLQSKCEVVVASLNIIYKQFVESLAVCYGGEAVDFHNINMLSRSRFLEQLALLRGRLVDVTASDHAVFNRWLSSGEVLLNSQVDLDLLRKKFLMNLRGLNTRLAESAENWT